MLTTVAPATQAMNYCGNSAFDITQPPTAPQVSNDLNCPPGHHLSGQPQDAAGASGDSPSFIMPATCGTQTLFLMRSNPDGWTDASTSRLCAGAYTPPPEVELWIAAALAGAFSAFWVNRFVLEGTPEQPSPNLQPVPVVAAQ